MTTALLISLMVGPALAACSTPDPGMGGTTSAGMPSSSGNAAPALPQPEISIEKFRSDPCAILTPQQKAEAVGGLPGEVWAESKLGPACRWRAGSTPAKVSITATLDNTSGGIAELFKQPKNYAVFEPVTAGGQPGAVTMFEDGRKEGDCSIQIGLTKDTLLWLSVRLGTIGGAPPDFSNPCARATRFAELAIATMKAAG
ncbi:DUF3558 domain-containing protein [Crossiella equi]|uniref:DUF3558 domain-containing protein n=1 Tax=Crossiella equi TaxID=130796 RepID=UPI000A374DA4|nr:DUF3558 domain-containing protein [Crossiella equi]